MNLEDDRRLLDAFRRGQPQALDRVYRAYAQDVARVLRFGFTFEARGRRCRFHGLKSPFDLEDRLQDTFARAFSHRARNAYDGLQPYRKYIQSIARNLIIDEFRRNERALRAYEILERESPRDNAALSEPLRGTVEPSGRPETDAQSVELIRLVGQFENTLSSREKTVFELRFSDELEHEQIMQRTGLSASKIKTSEKRIRNQFFKFMRRHGYFSDYVQEPRTGWLRLFRRVRGGLS